MPNPHSDIRPDQPKPALLEPMHRNLPRGGLPLPFPEAELNAALTGTAHCLHCTKNTAQGHPGTAQAVNAEADRINTSWARHLAEISHELRTPLAGITGFASLLEGPDLSDEQNQLVSRINECSSIMLDVVNDILDEAMAQSGDVPITPQPFSPAQLARDCTALIAAANGEAAVAISCRIDPEVPGVARGDAQRIRQILVNLMANASAASHEGVVELVVRRRGSRTRPKLLWSIVDNGRGLSPDERSRLFIPFERCAGRNDQSGREHSIHPGKRRNMDKRGPDGGHTGGPKGGPNIGGKGAGLGLSISQKLAEKMGGRITVRSTQRRGSIFTFHQPLARTTHVQVPISSLNSLLLPRILLVQPRSSKRNLNEAVLQVFGFQFDCIDDPGQIITMLRSAENNNQPYIAALVDIDEDTDTACHVVATMRRAGLSANLLPFYALSRDSSPAMHRRCSEAGFQDILLKPLSHAAFAGLARILIASEQASPQCADYRPAPTTGRAATA